MVIETPSSIFKNAAKQPAVTEGLFRQFVEAAALGIVVVDTSGTMTYVNQSLCDCFGYERDELVGRPIEILVPEPLQIDHVALRNAYFACPTQRMLQGREISGLHKNGSTIPVAIGLNPLIQGDNIKVACTIMDQSEFRNAEAMLANFFELSLDLFCVANMQGYFVKVNPSFPELLWYPEAELLGRPFFDFVHPDDIASTRRAMSALAKGHPVIRFRNRYRTIRGKYVWLEWSARDVSADGMIYAAARDITEDLRNQDLKGQLKLATEFQKRLYPPDIPSVAGLDLAGAAQPASHLCGDYYDFIVAREGGRVVIAVGDVSGHGVGPAMAMVEVRSIIRGMLYHRAQLKLADALRELNGMLIKDLPDARFVTLFLLEIDAVHHRLNYASAGHQALLFRAGTAVQPLRCTAPPLGLLEQLSTEVPPPIDIAPDDVILICTDGVTEARDDRKQLYGWQRTAECVSRHLGQSSAEIIGTLFEEVREFAGKRDLDDDMTAVAIKLLPI